MLSSKKISSENYIDRYLGYQKMSNLFHLHLNKNNNNKQKDYVMENNKGAP